MYEAEKLASGEVRRGSGPVACSAAGSKLQDCLVAWLLAVVCCEYYGGLNQIGPLQLRPWMRPPFYDRRRQDGREMEGGWKEGWIVDS